MNPRADSSARVVLVSHGFQSHYELGFANGLARNGLDVLLLGSDTTLVDRLHPRVELRNIRGSQDPRRPRWRKALGLLAYHARLLLTAVRERGTPVVVIGMLGPEWFVGVLENLWLRACSGRLSLVVHNVVPHNRDAASMRRVYRLIYRIADQLLVHTEATRAALVDRMGVDATKMLLVRHGVNDAITQPSHDKAAAKQALGLGALERTVLFFGVASPYKGIDLLLDAAEREPGLRLLVAGTTPDDDFGAEVRRRLVDLVAGGRAWWHHGFVADADVPGIFAAADLVALPYRRIDQSGVLVLALSLGVPVLATAVGGMRELVNERNGLLIDEPSAEALVAGLRAFFAAPLAPTPRRRARDGGPARMAGHAGGPGGATAARPPDYKSKRGRGRGARPTRRHSGCAPGEPQ